MSAWSKLSPFQTEMLDAIKKGRLDRKPALTRKEFWAARSLINHGFLTQDDISDHWYEVLTAPRGLQTDAPESETN